MQDCTIVVTLRCFVIKFVEFRTQQQDRGLIMIFMSDKHISLTGSRSSFMNSGHELSDIVEMTRQLVSQLKANHARRKRDANPFGEAWERDVCILSFHLYLIHLFLIEMSRLNK